MKFGRRAQNSVFAISLAEVAWTLVFVLMLLLGYMVVEAVKKQKIAEQRAQNGVDTDRAQEAERRASEAMAAFQKAAKEGGVIDPDALAIKLTYARELDIKIEQLKQENLDLTKKLVPLQGLANAVGKVDPKDQEEAIRREINEALRLMYEIDKALAGNQGATSTSEMRFPTPSLSTASPTSRAASSPSVPLAASAGTTLQPQPLASAPRSSKAVLDYVRTAIGTHQAFRKEMERQFGKPLDPGSEPGEVGRVVTAAAHAGSASRDGRSLEELRTVIKDYERRLGGRGLVHPPCWKDAQGKIEYIFSVHTASSGISVTRAWPQSRAEEAPRTEGYAVLMGGSSKELSSDTFGRGARSYLAYGEAQKPACRHFVRLTTSITDADERDRMRRVVNRYFYLDVN